jgi:RecJ-like exonuclease
MGNEDDTKPQQKCPACQGSGWIVLLTSRTECPDCKGSGISEGRFDPKDEDLEFDDENTPPRGTRV